MHRIAKSSERGLLSVGSTDIKLELTVLKLPGSVGADPPVPFAVVFASAARPNDPVFYATVTMLIIILSSRPILQVQASAI